MKNDMLQSKKPRAGFTLVELLVVIAIIAILASLATWGVFAVLGSRQQRNTEATIRVVNKLMQDRYAAVIKSADAESPSAAVLNLAGGDNARAKVIWKKVRLMEAFPQRYSDVQNPVVLSSLIPAGQFKPYFARYQTALAGKTGGGPGESSACLLLSLKTLNADGMLAVQDQLTYAIGTSDGVNTIDLFIDSWGNPLVFTRFGQSAAIQSANPAAGNPNAKTAKFADPVDSGGLLLSPNWYPSALRGPPNNANSFEARIHLVSPDNGANAFYTIPVIQSAGKDGALGSADDIFSFNLKGD